jgi:hypothetical protein
MAAGPPKTISFLPLAVKEKTLRDSINHGGHREHRGKRIEKCDLDLACYTIQISFLKFEAIASLIRFVA